MDATAIRYCPHCVWMEANGLSHTKDCKCGHHHADHNYCGGCKVKGCLCDRYDQTMAKSALLEMASKTKPGTVVEFAMADINLDKLTGDTQKTYELMQAQARLDKLRIQKDELEKGNMAH
jgi:hypothetical protein